MANEYAVNRADLVSVADAIRSRSGAQDALSFPDGFVQAVGAIAGEGGVQLLYTATITEPVQAIKIDVAEEWKRFDALVCVPDVTFSATEWLCCQVSPGVRNYIGTNGSTGLTAYTPERAEIICTFSDDAAFAAESTGSYVRTEKSAVTEIALSTYYGTNTFTGGTVKIVGVKF